MSDRAHLLSVAVALEFRQHLRFHAQIKDQSSSLDFGSASSLVLN
jgi:hypothetical protein